MKEPPAVRLPVSVKELVVLTLPVIERLSKVIPVPLMVLVVPVKVLVPPLRWVKMPAPVVAKLPAIFSEVAAAAVILEAATVISLKLLAPVPLSKVPAPVKLTVLVLPVKVPLLVQLPATVWEKLPPLKVVEVPRLTLPLMVNAAAAVKDTDVPEPIVLVRLPAIIKGVAGNVLVAAPDELLSVRLPYVLASTVWAVPAYSTVLARLRVRVA